MRLRAKFVPVLEPAERIWYHTGMILFHGSNQVVESPCLMPKARALDFGEALQRLLPQRLRDQFAFKTELAISCLSFKEAVAV